MRAVLIILALWVCQLSLSGGAFGCLQAAVVQDEDAAAVAPQGADRIQDEAEEARIADEAADLELINEFIDLEQKVAVKFEPRLAARGADLDHGVMASVGHGDGGNVYALWPSNAKCESTFVRNVYKFVPETRTREYSVVTSKTEQRTRVVTVTKQVPVTKTRTVTIPYTDENGKESVRTEERAYTEYVTVAEQVEQTYTVQVPVTETRTQSYTVNVPVVEQMEYTRSVPCVSGVAGQVVTDLVPLFHGDRSAATWAEFLQEVPQGESRQVVFFATMEDWRPEWDAILTADAFVVVTEVCGDQPVVANGLANQLLLNKPIKTLPVLAKRSRQPEHQFAFSPYVELVSYRPYQLPVRPRPFAELTTNQDGSAASEITQSSWIYEIEHDADHWLRADRSEASLLDIEETLVAGGDVLMVSSDDTMLGWSEVFRRESPVYRADGKGQTELPSDLQIARQCDALVWAKESLRRGDAVRASQLLREITIPQLLEPTLLCKVAYGLHLSGLEGSAHAFVGVAMRMTPDPLERSRLIRQQGSSRVWLESTVMQYPYVQPSATRANEAIVKRMDEIQKRVLRPRSSLDYLPQPVDATQSEAIHEAEPMPIPAPIPQAQPAIAPTA